MLILFLCKWVYVSDLNLNPLSVFLIRVLILIFRLNFELMGKEGGQPHALED